ncbi:MAG: M20/M25/M40 family metallo-hydrolase [Acidobacteria bacterium]|nr:M20/M25/M40 family metallo-hydrolase [Acidobacteriota bacterium]
MRRVLWLLPFLLCLSSAAAQEIDWATYQDEAVRRLSRYLQVNTSNPPGNELAGAKFFQQWFEAEGIEVDIFEFAPGRANLIARLRGDGSKRPLILANHTDVVRANAEAWRVEPFSGAIVDGYMYGRGALDMKGLGLAQAMVFVLLKREQVPLARDVIFLMTADEEVGLDGAEWLVEHKRELLSEAEFLLTEGGQNLVEDGRIKFFGVDTAEKTPFWLRVRARGTPGHGSRPQRDAASHRLARAMARVVDWETPIHLLPGVEKFFRDVAPQESGERAWKFRHLREAIQEPEFLASLTGDGQYNYLLRNTVSLTVLRGSEQTNVIPGEALAHLDVRLLPGQKPEDFLEQLRHVMGDASLEIEPLLPFRPANESSIDTDLFRAIEAAVEQEFPGSIVTTRMLSGYTESGLYRELGIASYGFSPFLLTREEGAGVHGDNESLSVENVRRGVRFLYQVVEPVVRR